MAKKMAFDLSKEVLNAAQALFMADGYEAVGMRDIAKQLGKHPTQIYRLKLSKSDILAELILRLNQEQIDRVPELRARVIGNTPFERTCSYLEALYVSDIQHLPIRSVGAAFGWLWSADYERKVIEQVFELIKPIVGWMQEAGLEDIQPRCLGIWSLYYVGYRHAVMQEGSAAECLATIRPSLRFYFAA
ncbi:MAG: hypothetical protein RIR18_1345 [Pseudomonadota bacterium]|jgi:AcrR family transcriptional regulator